MFRATSTIATALFNGAEKVIPVANVEDCIELGKKLNAVTAGERDGKVIPGLQHGNSPAEYYREFIQNKILVLTTTNGTRLLHMALKSGAVESYHRFFPQHFCSVRAPDQIKQRCNSCMLCMEESF